MNAAPGDERPGAAAFPWDEAMAAAFGVLRLSPAVFWAMSPREFAQALRPYVGALAPAPRRDTLEALMRRFPDTRREVEP